MLDYNGRSCEHEFFSFEFQELELSCEDRSGGGIAFGEVAKKHGEFQSNSTTDYC